MSCTKIGHSACDQDRMILHLTGNDRCLCWKLEIKSFSPSANQSNNDNNKKKIIIICATCQCRKEIQGSQTGLKKEKEKRLKL